MTAVLGMAILRQECRAQLILAIALPLFQMATGINAVVFFPPQLVGGVGSFGEGAKGGLIASAVIGAVQVDKTAMQKILLLMLTDPSLTLGMDDTMLQVMVASKHQHWCGTFYSC